MAGTPSGGVKAAAKNKSTNPNFYKEIGAIGGKKSRGGGFAAKVPCSCNIFHYDHFIANCAGKRGGKISRRKNNLD